MSSVRIICLSRAIAPITHAAGVAGNEQLIACLPVVQPDGSSSRVPMVSGNSLRHVSVRAPGMRWLLEECGLATESLSLEQLNFLFHGGRMPDTADRLDTARVAEMHDAWPILRLLGGCDARQTHQGSLKVGHAWLCCEESRAIIEAILGEESLRDLPPLLPARSFVRSYTYYTYDSLGHEADLASRAKAGDDGGKSKREDTRMIYAGEMIQPGACLAHDYTLTESPTPEEVGCVLWSLELWSRAGGVVGGQGGKGHGRLHTRALIDGIDADPAALVGAYLSHVRAMKDRAIAWLEAAFAKPDKPKGKGAGKGKGKGKESPETQAEATTP